MISRHRILAALIIIVIVFFLGRSSKLCRTIVPKSRTVQLPEQQFYPYIAVLVEFRVTILLPQAVLNVNDHIPSSWPIQIFHGRDNQDFILESPLKPMIKGKKILLSLTNRTYNKTGTNELLTDANFWRRVRGEKILLFQIDSAMCSNPSNSLSEFLEYDYVGAPWDKKWYGFSDVYLVGNGGFSIRSRSKMLQLIKALPYNFKVPEDVWYAMNMEKVNGRIPPLELAKKFSVETIFYDRPIGVHRFPHNCSTLEQLYKACPEAKRVMLTKCEQFSS